MSRRGTTTRERGFGPFTGRQLTTIVCVAIVALVMIPTAAIAAGASFTSKSNATPALRGTNSGSSGVGVVGKGTKFGVFSNGPLGVANGKALSCAQCVTASDVQNGAVTPAALSSEAKSIQPLTSGQSESGTFALWNLDSTTGQNVAAAGLTFVRPAPGSITMIDVDGIGPVTHCAGAGHADPGYACFYETLYNVNGNGLSLYPTALDGQTIGANVYESGTSAGSFYVGGIYTVTAP